MGGRWCILFAEHVDVRIGEILFWINVGLWENGNVEPRLPLNASVADTLMLAWKNLESMVLKRPSWVTSWTFE